MAIQFFCSSCGQPIEVDDEMANQTVTCPYCRAAAHAPGASDPRVRSTAPQADSVEAAGVPAGDVGAYASVVPGFMEPPPVRSSLGWVALGCMVVAAIAAIIVIVTSQSIAQGLPQPGPNPSQEEIQQFQQQVQQQVQQRVAEHPWFPLVLLLGLCALPLTGLICAIIALVKRARPKWPAITSLALVGLVVLVVCASVALGLMQGGGQLGGG